MQFSVSWIENKGADWKVATLVGLDKVITENVSINRVNKKGEVFPNFDGVILGATIEAELWKSPTNGKAYLFPPRVVGTKGGGANIAKMMDKKTDSISKSMDRKEESIAMSSAMRDATLIVVNLYKELQDTDNKTEAIKETWREWRDFFLKEHK